MKIWERFVDSECNVLYIKLEEISDTASFFSLFAKQHTGR